MLGHRGPRGNRLALVVVATLLVGCLGRPAAETPPAAALRFLPPVVIEEGARGYETTLAVNGDGIVVVCSIRGVGRGTDLWVSEDGGESFSWVGMPQTKSAVPVRQSGAEAGGGDCDVAADESGRFYVADLWVGGVSIASSTDGRQWSGIPASILAAPLDRPWLAGGSDGEVFLTAAQLATTGFEQQNLSTPPPGGIWSARSTDAGRTFPDQQRVVDNERRILLNGNIARSPDGWLYIPFTRKIADGLLALDVAVSSDAGTSWRVERAAELPFVPRACAPLYLFPIAAAGDDGAVAVAWVLDNPSSGRYDLFVASSPDRGTTWLEPLLVTDRDGTRAFPALASGSGGRLAVAWFETPTSARLEAVADPAAMVALDCAWSEDLEQAEWHVRLAVLRATGEGISVVAEGPVTSEPFHRGPMGRPYGERFGLATLPDGRAAVVFPMDTPGGEARPVFVRQAAGATLLDA